MIAYLAAFNLLIGTLLIFQRITYGHQWSVYWKLTSTLIAYGNLGYGVGLLIRLLIKGAA